jgi:LPS-assembly protein
MPLGGLTIKHKFNYGSVGFAKRYRRMSGDFNNEMDYSEIFVDIGVNSNFKIIAKLKRDDEMSKNIESLIGIEYENCCLAIRITGSDKNLSRYMLNQEILYPHLSDAWDNMIQIESKGRINFEFELKGLNSSFDKINRFLNNSLFNY